MKAPSATYELQSAERLSVSNEMMIGQSIPVKTAQPLTAQTPKKIIDLGNTSSEDLKSMKENDPFMFYSIPGARRATMLNQDIDTSHLDNTIDRRLSVSSCPGRFQSPQVVARSTCISVEAHPDVFLEDALLEDVDVEEDFDFDFTDDLKDLDLLLRFYDR